MEEITRRASVMALKDLAYRAHQWTSFHPEKRGEMLLNDCETELQAYLAKLPAEMHEHFEQRYLELYAKWLSACSRCISSFITGSAKFPVKRAEKLNNWERGAREKLDNWAKRFVDRVCNPTQHRLTGWAEIERLQDKVEKLTALQEAMKSANSVIRKKKLTEEEKLDELVALGFSEANAKTLLEEPQYSFMRKGFQQYQLTNNLAKIKDAQQRIARLQNMVDREDAEGMVNGVRVVYCYSEERLRLYFDGKPDGETISKLKKAAFKWSTRNGAWQRQLTSNAIYAAESVLGVEKLNIGK